jgi:hypothetical protein
MWEVVMYAGKLLVVFYSRTRTTRRAASALAGMLDADVEEIVVTRGRAGPFGCDWHIRDRGRHVLPSDFRFDCGRNLRRKCNEPVIADHDLA